MSQSLRAEALRAYGSSLGIAGRFASAEEVWTQSLALFEQLEDEHGRAVLLHRLGISAMWRGDPERARELAREAGSPWWESGALAELACLSLNAGLVEEGETRALESLAIAQQLRDRAGRVSGVGLLARVAAERSQPERAGRLWGAIEDADAGAPSVAGDATARHVKAEFASSRDPSSSAVTPRAAL